MGHQQPHEPTRLDVQCGQENHPEHAESRRLMPGVQTRLLRVEGPPVRTLCLQVGQRHPNDRPLCQRRPRLHPAPGLQEDGTRAGALLERPLRKCKRLGEDVAHHLFLPAERQAEPPRSHLRTRCLARTDWRHAQRPPHLPIVVRPAAHRIGRTHLRTVRPASEDTRH